MVSTLDYGSLDPGLELGPGFESCLSQLITIGHFITQSLAL